MSDERLRALGRASREGDDTAYRRRRAEWLRRGLGYFGERLPDVTGRGVALGFHPLANEPHYTHVLSTGARTTLGIHMVYVPGGNVACSACGGSGEPIGPRDMRAAPRPIGRPPENCTTCHGEGGARTIAPFYLGRFPVTWNEYVAWIDSKGRQDDRARSGARNQGNSGHPVVNVTRADAEGFCSWAGLRLPTIDEWRWAAFGGCLYVHSPNWACGPACNEGVQRVFPWGGKPPTPELCVWLGHPKYGERMLDPRDPHGYGLVLGETAPVFADGEEPARPDGAAWCDAQDMAGNVWEIVNDDKFTAIMGGSYRSQMPPGEQDGVDWCGWLNVLAPRPDIGFRVALSAERPIL